MENNNSNDKEGLKDKIFTALTIENVHKDLTVEEQAQIRIDYPEEISQSFFAPAVITDNNGRELEFVCSAKEDKKIVQYYRYKVKD